LVTLGAVRYKVCPWRTPYTDTALLARCGFFTLENSYALNRLTIKWQNLPFG
jgi:hypothetical protein